LEGLNYNMYYNNHSIVRGSIGSQLVSDIFQSKSEFPVVGNGSLVLKDSQKFEKGSSKIDNEAFTNILGGDAHQLVNGTVFYKQISNIQSYGGTQQFEATFPQSFPES
jgi:predicted house-cleaning NTP pyrophosphatase (Maf/HAM1 superfamily)